MIQVLCLLFVLSGAAGLIYESIWTRYLGLFVGHDAYAQIVVLVIFLGGMSVGAMVVSRWGHRVRNPLLAYALVEFAVGCIGLVFHDVYVWTTSLAYGSLYPALAGSAALPLAKWALASALILPQSILLGATFPLMSAGVLRLNPSRPGRSLALLYFANSLGAAAGVLVAGFYLVALAGLPGTLLTAAMLNLGVGVLTIGVGATSRRKAAPGDVAVPLPAEASRTDQTAGLERLLLGAAFGTAVASFIYEIAWIRMLSLVLGSATHSFELMLSAFILGIAMGALWIHRRADTLTDPARTLGIVQWVMGSLALATLPLYAASFGWVASLLAAFARSDQGYAGFTIARYAICLVIMLPATFCAGMTLPLLTRTLLGAGSGERAIGAVYGWNTLGSIVGVVVAGLALLPVLGLKGLLLAGAALDMTIGVGLLRRGARREGRGARLWLAAAVGAVVVLAWAGLGIRLDRDLMISGVYRLGKMPEPGALETRFYRDGRTATVSVVRGRSDDRLFLATNGKTDASLGPEWRRSCDSTTARLSLGSDAATQTLLPTVTLAHVPSARSAAIIGFGSGMSSHVLLGSPGLQQLVTIEIEPMMVEGARAFYPVNRRVYDDPRSTIVVDDAKSYFATEHRRFDLILSEPSNPWVSGVSGLFTSEFYARVGRYLTDDGVFGQWIHTYELDDALVTSVLAGIHRNFRDYDVFLVAGGDLLIVATNRAELRRPDWSVVNFPEVRKDLCHFRSLTPDALDNLRLIGRRALAPLLDDYPQPNSDYYPVLDLGAEQRRFRRDHAAGFEALSAEWHNFLASIDGGRTSPGDDPLARLPETPRVDARAVDAYLRGVPGSTGADIAADARMREAGFALQQWRTSLASNRAPTDWELWSQGKAIADRYHDAATAGVVDEEGYGEAAHFLERHQAPAVARDLLAFRHGIRAWDFAQAAAAADRLMPVVIDQRRWITADELRDGAVMAHLHTGNVAGARAALDALGRFSARRPGDLRSELLAAYVRTAEHAKVATR
jgi:spermidine synthase